VRLYPKRGCAARIEYQVPVKAYYRDKRRHWVNALLHVDANGKLAELDFVTIGCNDWDDRVASLPKVGAATINVAPCLGP